MKKDASPAGIEVTGLQVENLSVVIGRHRLLDDVTCEARAGELVLLLGPNGAGKSTFLKAVAGLIPCSGRVLWQGRDLRTDVRSAGPQRRNARTLAYLPQGHLIHWPLIARDVVAIGRMNHGGNPARLSAADKEAIDRALAEVEAEAFADRPATELSGGERARVMLARALAVEAPLLLADEPIASLDPAHRLSVMALLQRLAHDGRTIVAVIHDLTLAARFADRVILIKDGRIAANGPPDVALAPGVIADVFDVDVEMPELDGRRLPVAVRSRLTAMARDGAKT